MGNWSPWTGLADNPSLLASSLKDTGIWWRCNFGESISTIISLPRVTNRTSIGLPPDNTLNTDQSPDWGRAFRLDRVTAQSTRKFIFPRPDWNAYF